MVTQDSRLKTQDCYDVVVIGAGHAGCEAANASAGLGAKTLLLTTSLDTIGWIACSPSFGGPGRGQLLRELDALGGLMSKVIDESAIHFRHSGKDSACWAPFAICDRYLYHRKLKQRIEDIKNLYIKQDTVEELMPLKGFYRMTTATGQTFKAKSVVIAAGTFLKGRTLQGQSKLKAGRNNEISADSLANNLNALGFKMGVFRSGTGPIISAKKTDFKGIEKQPFDRVPRFFSFDTVEAGMKQVPTFKTYTNVSVHRALKRHSANNIKGPRHCPSLMDKITRFPEKEAHPVFVQPEGKEPDAWFVNGMSMNFVDDEQQGLINKIKGLENAQIVRNGYSVSYYYLKSGQLNGFLESKNNKRLFFAGQVTGSSGYEEAASAGLIAGLNAALMAKGNKPIILSPNQAYVGVLVDDLANKKIIEPYRMLTARVEDRLLLRCDNADLRLAPQGYRIGLLKKSVLDKALTKEKIIKKAVNNGGATKHMASDIKREIEIIKKYKPYLKQLIKQ